MFLFGTVACVLWLSGLPTLVHHNFWSWAFYLEHDYCCLTLQTSVGCVCGRLIPFVLRLIYDGRVYFTHCNPLAFFSVSPRRLIALLFSRYLVLDRNPRELLPVFKKLTILLYRNNRPHSHRPLAAGGESLPASFGTVLSLINREEEKERAELRIVAAIHSSVQINVRYSAAIMELFRFVERSTRKFAASLFFSRPLAARLQHGMQPLPLHRDTAPADTKNKSDVSNDHSTSRSYHSSFRDDFGSCPCLPRPSPRLLGSGPAWKYMRFHAHPTRQNVVHLHLNKH